MAGSGVTWMYLCRGGQGWPGAALHGGTYAAEVYALWVLYALRVQGWPGAALWRVKSVM